MDPISALGVAAAVVQFTDFAGRLLSRTWKTYYSPTGQKSEDFRLTVVASDLTKLTSTLVSHLETGSMGRNDGVDAQLLQLCRECESISVDLQATLEASEKRQVNSQGQPRRLRNAGDIFREAISALWNEEAVENARRSLESIHRRMLDTITTSIWIDSRKTKGWESEFTKKLDNAVESLERAVTIVGETGPKKHVSKSKGMEPLQLQISQPVKDEMIQLIWDPEWTPDHALLKAFPKNSDAKPEQVGSAIARTLQYETIKRREEAIASTFQSTYDWVFRRRPTELDGTPSWSSVPCWLEAEANGIYWITGKPGSGKSTMMKFMMKDSRLIKHLRIWSAKAPLYVAHYYACGTGKQLDKSRTGLMRSLLHQIVSAKLDLASILCPRRWALFHATRDSLRFPEWSDWELEESFTALLKHVESNMRILLFVDGLDEFDTPPVEIINLIRRIVAEPGIKICAASRPWPEFRDAFRGCPNMQMHHLTYSDIQMYTHRQFSESQGFLEMKDIYPEAANSLVNDVVAKSKGVFLWTAIVTNNLLESLSEGANLQQLRTILDRLPDDIEKLYDAILVTIPPRLLPEMSEMLLIFKAGCHPLDWFTMWLADEFRSANLHPDRAPVVFDLRIKALPSLKRRLAARCRGLLDLEIDTAGSRHTICYLHRTVAEWIERPGVWEQISSNVSSDFDPYACLFVAEMLLMCPLHPTFNRPLEFWKSIARSLFYASLTRCPSVNMSVSQFVTAMDTFNMRAQQAFNTIPWKHLIVDKNWTRSTGRSIDFLGLAAEFCIAPYVRENVTKKSLEFKKLRNADSGLLGKVIFGPQDVFGENPLRDWDLNLSVIPRKNRLQLVEFLIQHKVQIPDDLRREILERAAKDRKYFQELVVLMESNSPNRTKNLVRKLFRWMSSIGR